MVATCLGTGAGTRFEVTALDFRSVDKAEPAAYAVRYWIWQVQLKPVTVQDLAQASELSGVST